MGATGGLSARAGGSGMTSPLAVKPPVAPFFCESVVAVFEVELKFAVTDPDELRSRLEQLGARWDSPVFQCDQYFAHPARDFATTDEALRLRSVGDEHILTYKGPVLDKLTKTRQELETPLATGPDAVRTCHETLVLLGFRPVRRVEKWRRSATLVWQETSITCAWDEVPPLGVFVEFEIVTDDAGRTAAANTILALAASLGLTQSERRSYLKMLIERDQQP